MMPLRLKPLPVFVLIILLSPRTSTALKPRWIDYRPTFSPAMPALELVTQRRHSISPNLTYDALRFRRPPDIDGELSDWARIKYVSLDSKEQLCLLQKRFTGFLYADQILQFRNRWWHGPENFSGKIYMGWDRDNLYIAFDVVSDVPFFDSSMLGALSRLWKKPKVGKRLAVLGFDILGNSNYYREGKGLEDLQIEFRVNRGYPTVRVLRECLGEFHEIDCLVEIVTHEGDEGYTLEASIPWELLEPLDPVLFNDIGLAIQINSFKDHEFRGFLSWGSLAPQAVHSDLTYGRLHFDTESWRPDRPEAYVEMTRYYYDDAKPLLIDIGFLSRSKVGDVKVVLSIEDTNGRAVGQDSLIAEGIDSGVTRRRIRWPIEALDPADYLLKITLDGGSLPGRFSETRTFHRFSFESARVELESLEDALRKTLDRHRRFLEEAHTPLVKEREAIAMFKMAHKAGKAAVSVPDRRKGAQNGGGSHNIYDILQKLEILRRLESGIVNDPRSPVLAERIKSYLTEIINSPAWEGWKQQLLASFEEGPQDEIGPDSPLCQVLAADQYVPVIWDAFGSEPDFRASGMGVFLGPLCIGSCAVIEFVSETDAQVYAKQFITEGEFVKPGKEYGHQDSPTIEGRLTTFNGRIATEVRFDGRLLQLVMPVGNEAIRIIGFTPEITYRIAEWILNRHTITSEDIDSLRAMMGSPFEIAGLREIIRFDFSGVNIYATEPALPVAQTMAASLDVGSVNEIAGDSHTIWLSVKEPPPSLPLDAPCSRAHLEQLRQRGNSGILLNAPHTPDLEYLAFALESILKTFRDERRSLYAGDLQFHSRSSGDGTNPSGAYFTCLATMLNFMDFAGMSDHDTVISTELVLSMFRDRNIDYNLMLNQEVTNGVTHFVGINIDDRIDHNRSPEQIISDIKESGGVVIAGHHGFSLKDWLSSDARGAGSHDDSKLRWVDIPLSDWRRIGVDAFEIGRGTLLSYFDTRALPTTAYNMIPLYNEWVEDGDVPPVVADTDIHYPSFLIPLRTIVFSRENTPEAIAESIRDGYCLAFVYNNVYGPDELVAAFYAAVSDENYLRDDFRDRLISRAESLRW
ncbi:MAG: hypothetical protein ACE5OP_07985 [Candidatus Glassbacteria bacterium]